MKDSKKATDKDKGLQALDSRQVQAKLKPIIAAKPEILFAYLFGSAVKGTAGRLSDIDLAVFLGPSYRHHSAGYGYRSELSDELSSLLAVSVDVVILNNAKALLRYEVIKNGVLLYSRSNTKRRSFHEKTTRDYLDLKPLYQVQRDYMRNRLREGTFGGGQTG